MFADGQRLRCLSAGLSAADDGKKLASTTKRLA